MDHSTDELAALVSHRRSSEAAQVAEATPAALAALLARAAGHPLGAPDRIIHRCAGGCDLEVAVRNAICEACSIRESALLRAQLVRPAIESVTCGADDVPRVGSDAYRLATAKGRAAAGHEGAARALGGHWKRSDGSLLVVGPTGAGKTTCIRGAALRILELVASKPMDPKFVRFACGIRFVSALDLARARSTIASRHSTAPALERAARTLHDAEAATLLLLDEIGSESSGFDPSAVRDTIEFRYRHRRPMLCTSGKTIAQLVDRYGEAAARKAWASGRVVDLFAGVGHR
jgi:hypothetical protein